MTEERIKVGDWVEEIGSPEMSGEVVGVNTAPNGQSQWITVKITGKVLERMYQEEYLRIVPNYVHNWLRK